MRGCADAVLKAGIATLSVCLSACGGGGKGSSGSGSGGTATPVTVSLAVSPVVVAQDGSATSVQMTVNSSSETAVVSFIGLPAGVQEKYAASDTNPSGPLTFIASASTPAGTYTPILTVNSAGQTVSMPFTMVVAVVASVSGTVDATSGVKGKLEQFMSTSFQIAEFSGDFFGTDTAAREATLNNLGPQHIRLQPISQAVPMQGNTGAATDWDFTLLDQVVQPVLGQGDHSPELQLATAPAWMCDASGHLDVANHAKDFAAYAANVVRYYNKGGFDAGGTHFQSASKQPVTWWGVFNEPDFNGLAADDYITLYNTTAPAMLKVDPSIKLVALEFSGSTLGTGYPDDPETWLPPFFAAKNAGGVNAQVDAVAMHMYGSCDQLTTDAVVFDAVPQYAAVASFIESQMKSRTDLAGAALWVTENNVNADFADAKGMSNCNPAQAFVADGRGTSAYFAAWRPYVFSQFGKAGNQALYQWQYSGDKQYGEVDGKGVPYLSYWVDRTLRTMYPSTAAAPGPDILTLNATDTSSVETLATRGSDGTVRLMIVDKAVHAASDDNGSGDPRTVIVDTTSLGNFTAASLMTIDASTDVVKGPAGVGIAPAGRISVTLDGYGVAFVSLMP